RGRLRHALPATHLHPEPVVDEWIPEVLLPFHEVAVEAVEGPLARPLGDPPGGAALGLPPPRVDLLPGLARVAVRLALPLASGAFRGTPPLGCLRGGHCPF